MSQIFVRTTGAASRGPKHAQPHRLGWFTAPEWSAVAAVAVSLLLWQQTAFAKEDVPMNYPETKRQEVVDEHFGVSIPDPYRWLEQDIRRDLDITL